MLAGRSDQFAPSDLSVYALPDFNAGDIAISRRRAVARPSIARLVMDVLFVNPNSSAKAYQGLDADVETRRIVAAAVLSDQVEQLRSRGFGQFHFYTLNQANLTYAACRILGIVPKDLS